MLTLNDTLPNILFEYPGADVILRSHDDHHLRIPTSYLVHCSPVLDETVRKALNPPDEARGNTPLPVVRLPESGAILHSLLTFIFPLTPLVPSTTEEAMKLLSVAQKYQMVSVLAYIRYHIAQQNPPSTQRVDLLHSFSLAQKYGLRQEALQAAQTILMKYPMNIEDLEYELDVMPGASLYELWNYYGKVRDILAEELSVFRVSGAGGTLRGLRCVRFSSAEIPCWIDDYIASIGETPDLFDLIRFNAALALHIADKAKNGDCTCISIPSRNMRNFWESLMSVVHGSLKKVSTIEINEFLRRLKQLQAESALSLMREREESQDQTNSIASLPAPLDLPDANLIIRSSDLVDFRVHKSVLAMASPFFKDLLSLPQPSDSESVDGLPVVTFTEDAEVLNSLVSMLYPVHPVIHDSYDKVLHLLSVCQKYDMVQIQSSIRAQVSREGSPAPVGAEVFRAYAIASSKRLIPEMKKAASLTLDYPMTFESLGEGLRFFEGSALRDLARFRKRYKYHVAKCLDSFLEVNNSAPGPSNIWIGCPDVMPHKSSGGGTTPPPALPTWLRQLISQGGNNRFFTPSLYNLFMRPLITPSSIREKYLTAIKTHPDCNFCLWVHTTLGSTFCADLESRMTHAQDVVRALFLYFSVPDDSPQVFSEMHPRFNSLKF
jgi:hypothetical protein